MEASRGSFEEATDAIGRSTGTRWGKRQTEQLTRRAAVEFEGFYATCSDPTHAGDVNLARPGGLRGETVGHGVAEGGVVDVVCRRCGVAGSLRRLSGQAVHDDRIGVVPLLMGEAQHEFVAHGQPGRDRFVALARTEG